tara:strand:+ start:4076 stop:4573 length:498 start_codon:yes stop_codon:yes gene_type:complete
MSKVNLISTNKKTSTAVTFILVIYGFISFFVPTFLVNIIPQSAVGIFFLKYIFVLTVLFILFSIYFIIVGLYSYYLKIDAYVMYISSNRIISGLLKAKNYIEIPNDMLIQYSFFNRPFSFNKTLMIKIKDVSGKRIVKRFNFSFLSKRDEYRISNILEKIITKNK